MNSFKVYAVGVLARNPELVVKEDETFARFCLVGTDFKAVGEAVREYVTSVWFVAPEPVGSVLVRTCKKGDQLILEARVLANSWTDRQGQKQYDYAFEVMGFRYGATKGSQGSSVVSRNAPSQPPVEGGVTVAM
jgi:single-stranded DNA-binding protein